MDMSAVLKAAVGRGASEIQIRAGQPLRMRVDGGMLQAADERSPLTAEQAKELVFSALYREQREKLEKESALDCGFAIKGVARFNMHVQLGGGGVEAVIHVIPVPEMGT